MHMQNNPEIMQKNPKYQFPVIDIYEFFKAKIKFLLKNGVKKSQIIIDPGFGFGKNKCPSLAPPPALLPGVLGLKLGVAR